MSGKQLNVFYKTDVVYKNKTLPTFLLCVPASTHMMHQDKCSTENLRSKFYFTYITFRPSWICRYRLRQFLNSSILLFPQKFYTACFSCLCCWTSPNIFSDVNQLITLVSCSTTNASSEIWSTPWSYDKQCGYWSKQRTNILLSNKNEQALNFTCALTFCIKILLKEMQICFTVIH